MGEDRGDAARLRAERLEADLRHLVAERGTDAALTDAMHRLANASEQEILGPLAAGHPEVRSVHVVNEMPLTAVGKIFKPELKRREAKDALETALREAGVSFRTLDITHDRSRGMVAVLELEAGASLGPAREVLGLFALPFEIR